MMILCNCSDPTVLRGVCHTVIQYKEKAGVSQPAFIVAAGQLTKKGA